MAELAQSADAIRRATTRAKAVLAELEDDLRAKTSWWDTSWVEQVIRATPETFDRAFDRWRMLFRAALADQWEQNRRKQNFKLSEPQRIAAGRRAEAETQIALLRNEGSNDMNVSADFNPYRYLASEGFLPGYSFPRLPIAAYIPGRRGMRGEGDYVQRARFLAIREFGPRALIYHEGARYEVHRVQLPPDAAGEVRTEDAHRCPGCGYHHAVAPGNDRCEMCDVEFTASQYGLLPLHTVFTRQRQRITSDEEERRRAGFRIVTSYRFQDHGDRPGRSTRLRRMPTASRSRASPMATRPWSGARTSGLPADPPGRRTASGSTQSPATGSARLRPPRKAAARTGIEATTARPAGAGGSSRTCRTAGTSSSSSSRPRSTTAPPYLSCTPWNAASRPPSS